LWGFSITDKSSEFDSGYQSPPSKEDPNVELACDDKVPIVAPVAPPSDEWGSFLTSLSGVKKKKKKSKKSDLTVEEAAPPVEHFNADDSPF
jgi:hypothetical protein